MSSFVPVKKPTQIIRCQTDQVGRGQVAKAGNDSLVVDNTDGFVPLWQRGTVLRYKIDIESFQSLYANANETIANVERSFDEAFRSWRFEGIDMQRNQQSFDFIIHAADTNGDALNGYVLASAFFPSSNLNHFQIHPEAFTMGNGLVQTLQHEIGHVFGLRHWFYWRESPAKLFGDQSEKTIMNYGANSVLTDQDRADLQRMYNAVWSGEPNIFGDNTPVVLFDPYSTTTALMRSMYRSAQGKPISAFGTTDKQNEFLATLRQSARDNGDGGCSCALATHDSAQKLTHERVQNYVAKLSRTVRDLRKKGFALEVGDMLGSESHAVWSECSDAEKSRAMVVFDDQDEDQDEDQE